MDSFCPFIYIILFLSSLLHINRHFLCKMYRLLSFHLYLLFLVLFFKLIVLSLLAELSFFLQSFQTIVKILSFFFLSFISFLIKAQKKDVAKQILQHPSFIQQYVLLYMEFYSSTLKFLFLFYGY